MSDELPRMIEKYISHRIPEADDIRVSGVDRIHGGASRQTYRFHLQYVDAEGQVDRRLILRRDPPSSLIDTDRRSEYEAYQAFYPTRVAVPEMLWLEEDESWLDHPFFMMQELPDLEARPQVIVAPPYAEHAEKIGHQKWTILGEISKADPAALGLSAVMPAVALDAAWRRELDYWEGVIDEDELSPQPIARAAIRWLRRNPPPPAQRLSVVHGDYRTGNYLYDKTGGIRAILDWEMVHLGDPLEDLAWSLSPIFDFAGNGLAGGLIPRDRAIALWEAASGLRAEPERLKWWEVFTALKGQAIWVGSLQTYVNGSNRDPILAIASLTMMNRQDEAALSALKRAKERAMERRP